MEPITTSEGNGEPNGVLVVGRFVGAEEIAEVERTTELHISAGRPTARASILPRHPYGDGEELGQTYSGALDSETIESWATMRGMDGRAALVFAVRERREAMERACGYPALRRARAGGILGVLRRRTRVHHGVDDHEAPHHAS